MDDPLKSYDVRVEEMGSCALPEPPSSPGRAGALQLVAGPGRVIGATVWFSFSYSSKMSVPG